MVKTKKYKNGEVYTGKVRGGKREYYGRHHWPEKGDYVGEWSDDMMNGCGKYTWVDGRTFQGQFVNDMMCGRGCYMEKDYAKEIFGDFTNGVLNGRGVQFARTPDQKGCHVLVGVEFNSGKLIRGIEFTLVVENNEDKIVDLKQYKKNPSYVASTGTVRKSEKYETDAHSNSLPPVTPRVDHSNNNSATSQVEYVEFMEKQKYLEAKKEMQEKQKNMVLDFQNKLLALEEKLKDERQNNNYKQKCQTLEAELSLYQKKAEEAKVLEQQLIQQVQQQKVLFEAFETESNRHNRVMNDHINELEQRTIQLTNDRERDIKELKEKYEAELHNEHSKISDLENEIRQLRSQLEKQDQERSTGTTQLEILQAENRSLQEQVAQAQQLQTQQQAHIEQQQATIEELKRSLAERENTPRKKSPRDVPSVSPTNSPRPTNNLTTSFAKKLFTKQEETTDVANANNDIKDLRSKLKRVQSQREPGIEKTGNDNVSQIDFRSVLKNKVENKPEWIK
jgi:DNA repair exonuclease SbcCD ATPase subunit